MKHIHADNMLLYAQDAQETETPWLRWEWRALNVLFTPCTREENMFKPDFEYRRIDPYRELREALKQGKTIQFRSGDVWDDASTPVFDWPSNRSVTKAIDRHPPESYRVKPNDPYAHLREAQDRGEVIQERDLLFKTQWIEYEGSVFPREPNRYRIKPPEYNCRVKPKTVKRKLYKWAYQKDTLWHESKQFYEYTPQGLIVKYNSINAFRIDSTMIEVEA